jgi:hypothetical protein
MNIPEKIRITPENIELYPKFAALLKEGKIKFDSTGRFRYIHGAPVGDLILVRTEKTGNPVYKESAEEWFDPESPKAKEFIWP